MPISLQFRYLAALTSIAIATGAAGAGELSVGADTPTVIVSTRPASENFITLPALQYQFRVVATCDGGSSADAFSLSIADTRISIAREHLSERSNALLVTIPADQIPPVRVEGFCKTGTDEAGKTETIQIPSVLSAQSSLLCVSDTGSDMTYASTSLDILVNCQPPDDPAPE